VSKENRITVVRANVGEQPEIVEMDNTLEAFQEAVGGWIQTINLSDKVLAIMDEEGKIKGYEGNYYIPNDVVVGNCIFCSTDGEDFASLTVELQSEVIGFLQRNRV
jgi:hypothetical protein